MELTEDQVIEQFNKQWVHCLRNISLPYEYGWAGFSCGHNVPKTTNELTKIQPEKLY